MKKFITSILIVVAVILFCLNIKIFIKKKKWVLIIDEEYYKEVITIKLDRLNKAKIIKQYDFNDNDILKKEKKQLEDENYLLEVSDNNIIAKKEEKLKSYNQKLKELEKMGFKCK